MSVMELLVATVVFKFWSTLFCLELMLLGFWYFFVARSSQNEIKEGDDEDGKFSLALGTIFCIFIAIVIPFSLWVLHWWLMRFIIY